MTAISELIRHDEPLSYGATAVYPYKPMIERKYRFTSRFGDEVLLHRVEGDKIHIPRALCPVGPNDTRDSGQKVAYPKAPAPRPNQEQIFNTTAKMIQQGQSGIVCAYTGWGKTVLGCFAAAVAGCKTLVITTKDDIYMEWIKSAREFLGLPDHLIGEIRGDKCEVVGTHFVVAMVHSLSKDGRYPDWIGEGFGLVIYDECHRMPADQFMGVIDRFPARIRLGLSATVDRKDGKEAMLYAHIGPIRAKTDASDELMVPKVLRFHSSWECPKVFDIDKETGERKVKKMPHKPGETGHIEKIIAADPARNDFIADLIHSAWEKGRVSMIFSTQIEHLHALQRAAVKHGVKGKDIGFYVGATTKAEKQARENAKVKPVIFTNFQMANEGTNIPWIDTGILAMPRSDVRQACGRIRRVYEDKKFPAWMDIIDGDSPVFAGYAASRLKWYKSIGCEIVDMD